MAARNTVKERQWHSVPGYKGFYRVSTSGKVKSVSRWVNASHGAKRWVVGRVLKASTDELGYKRVSLWREGKGKSFLVHRLVMLAFVTNPDQKPGVNHKDCNPSNNHVSNLEWSDQLENMRHAAKNGLMLHLDRDTATGERNGNSKLDQFKVKKIRRRLALGHRVSRIARRFKVSEVTIRNIRRRKIWCHVH